ncbi:hypothetical protein RU90_GL001159 [Lactococcus lactis subsp. hordniae]|uniref:Uncharacterized protein n=1 Tax=Lactococcus lactis subsp. hordniae TaxID=203404 RepID=A0A2A5SBG7_LACLH|nr:hypothetical protein RU90_GL001159 [Lactococcus lactis subsp. hordniae]
MILSVKNLLTESFYLQILLFYIIANYRIFGKFSILLKEKTAETVFFTDRTVSIYFINSEKLSFFLSNLIKVPSALLFINVGTVSTS